jgi:hypothetical protein
MATRKNGSKQMGLQLVKKADINLRRKLGDSFLRLYNLRNTIHENTQIYTIDETMFPVLGLDSVNSLADYIVVFQFLGECIESGAIAEKVFTGAHSWVVINEDIYAEICRDYGIPVDAFKTS